MGGTSRGRGSGGRADVRADAVHAAETGAKDRPAAVHHATEEPPLPWRLGGTARVVACIERGSAAAAASVPPNRRSHHQRRLNIRLLRPRRRPALRRPPLRTLVARPQTLGTGTDVLQPAPLSSDRRRSKSGASNAAPESASGSPSAWRRESCFSLPRRRCQPWCSAGGCGRQCCSPTRTARLCAPGRWPLDGWPSRDRARFWAQLPPACGRRTEVPEACTARR